MTIGPRHDPGGVSERGVSGFFNLLLYSIFSVVGTLLGAIRATAVSLLQAIEHEVLESHPNTALDPSTVAVAVVKGVVEPGAGAGEAALSGISSERFSALVDATGNAPGWVDLLDQWRRGLIGDGELEHGIRTGLLRNEWVGFVKNIRYVPLSAVQYLSAAVRGHMSEGDAIAKAGTLGFNAQDAELLYQSLGSPPGVHEMLELWNRGYISESQVDDAVKESDYKLKYLDAIKRLAEYLPPPRTITALLRNGSISSGKAQELFQQYGLKPDLAAAYVADASHGRTATHKEASVGVVKSLFTDHLITRDQAQAWLVRIGYAADDSALLLDLATYEAKQKARTQAINKVRSLFIGKHIDDVTARADLAHLGVEIDQIAELIDIWGLEQTTPSKELTLGQLNQALKKGLITDDAFLTRVMNLGYAAPDAQLLHEIDIPPEQA